MKLISLSVYGSKPMYVQGAVANIPLMREHYPGWEMRVYHSVDAPVDGLRGHNDVHLVPMGKSKDQEGMFWRFLPAWEDSIDAVIFRDADSRLNAKEAAAVQEWLGTGKMAHCMHDHEFHRCLPLFGGMWGIRGGSLSREVYHRLNKALRVPQPRLADMIFLQRWVLPLIQNSLVRHSSYPVKWPGALPFPPHTPILGFVGQQYDNKGLPIFPKIPAAKSPMK